MDEYNLPCVDPFLIPLLDSEHVPLKYVNMKIFGHRKMDKMEATYYVYLSHIAENLKLLKGFILEEYIDAGQRYKLSTVNLTCTQKA
jgi:predicted DNA-binding ribbon-helix-helix protein